MADATLWVDNEDSTGAWNTAGSPPYLSAQDQPTNYIYSTNRNAVSGIYSFQTGPSSGEITSVTLYVYAYGVNSDNFDVYINSTDTGLGPPTSWGWVNVDVSSILTTWAQINAATIWFDRPNTDNDAGVDAAYLYIEYTDAAPGPISESETVTVTATPQVGGIPNPESNESITASATAIVEMLAMATSVLENITASDTPTVSVADVSDYEVSESESITVSDTPSAILEDLASSSADSITVSDAASLVMDAMTISGVDSITASDVALLAMGALSTSKAETITIADVVVALSVVMAVLKNETVIVSDDPTVNVEGVAGPTLGIAVTPGAGYYVEKPVIVG